MRIDIAKLRAERLARGISQEDAAEATSISARTLQRIENGHPPSLETARALAAMFQGLGVDLRVADGMRVDPPKSEAATAGRKRWSRVGIALGGLGSLAGITIGFTQGSMTSAELGAALGLLGLGIGLSHLIVEMLDVWLYRRGG